VLVPVLVVSRVTVPVVHVVDVVAVGHCVVAALGAVGVVGVVLGLDVGFELALVPVPVWLRCT